MAPHLSLRARLGLSAALVVALVVGTTTLLKDRYVMSAIEGGGGGGGLVAVVRDGCVMSAIEEEAREASAATAMGVAGELGERGGFPDEADVDALLSGFTRAAPALQSLTVTRAGGAPDSVLSTDESPAPEALALAAQAVADGRVVASPPGALLDYVAGAFGKAPGRHGAVVAAVSLEAAQRVRRQTERAAIAFAVGAILALVIALDFLARRIVLRPLAAMQ